MSISIRKYIDIVSGVGAGAGVRRRDLIARIFTTNPLVPSGSQIDFTDADDALEYFGAGSEEYKRSAFYFGWISKNITRAKRISFARWADVALAAQIIGNKTAKTLSSFTAINNGAFVLNIGSASEVISGINLTGAASLAAVATLVQTAIRTHTGTQYTGAVVAYDATRGSFNFTSGTTGAAVLSVAAPGTGTNLLPLLGWTGSGAIVSDGAAAQTVTEVLSESAQGDNNFGSFTFIPVLDLDEVEEAASWNATQNVLYQYHIAIDSANASAYYDRLKGYAGTGVTVSETADEYKEMGPMVILAATDYTKRNSVQNYMFQIFPTWTPDVTTTPESNALDLVRANYYGRTQTAGQNLDFYQRGILMGGPAAPVDMNVYANEQWLKDDAGAVVMELLLNKARVSANAKGRIETLGVLQSTITKALFNGTISVGKPLTQVQKTYIAEITGDENAWFQVQNIGYWIDCVITSEVTQDGRTEWKAVYTLIYSKDDAIRKVEGTHVLI